MSEVWEQILYQEGSRYPSQALLECPYEFFEEARAEAPVVHDPVTGSYQVYRHEDILFALKRSDLFDMSGLADGLACGAAKSIGHADPPLHTGLRRAASRPFTPSRIAAYEQLTEELADGLIDAFLGRGEVEFVAEYAYPLPALVICRLLGLPTDGEDWEELGRFSNLMGGGSGPVGDMTIPKMHDYMKRQAEARHAEPRDDVFSELVADQVDRDGALDVEYLAVISTELVAGSVITTGQMIASAMLLLLQHPDELAKVRADYSLIAGTLEESLRVESPVQWHPRYARSEATLPSGFTIPAGAHVQLVYASGNRDPDRFPEPERFRVDRDRRELKEHFGFGYGLHFCMGAPLARMEGTKAFERLFERVGEIRLAEGNDLRHIDNLHFRAVRELHLELTAR